KHVDGNWYRCSEGDGARKLLIVSSISSEYVEFLRRENIVEEGQGPSATPSSGPDQHYYEAGQIIVPNGNGAMNPFVTGSNNTTDCKPQAKTLNLRGVIQDAKRPNGVDNRTAEDVRTKAYGFEPLPTANNADGRKIFLTWGVRGNEYR